MSWQAALVRWQIRRRYRPRGQTVDNMTAEDMAAAFAARADNSRKMVPAPPGNFRTETVDLGEWAHLEGETQNRTVFYCHGGGYVWGDPKAYHNFAARLARTMSAQVFLLDYRLAPAHRCPAPLEDSLKAWDAAIARGMDPARTVIAGDSAGGGLALATMLALKERGSDLPAAACLISPLTDIAGTGESMVTRDKADPMLDPAGLKAVGRLYCGDQVALDDWRASPLHGDMQGLPPMMIQTGDCEILLSDSERLHQKVEAAGGRAELRVWPKMFHVWQLGAFFIPEGRRAIDELADFVKSVIR